MKGKMLLKYRLHYIMIPFFFSFSSKEYYHYNMDNLRFCKTGTEFGLSDEKFDSLLLGTWYFLNDTMKSTLQRTISWNLRKFRNDNTGFITKKITHNNLGEYVISQEFKWYISKREDNFKTLIIESDEASLNYFKSYLNDDETLKIIAQKDLAKLVRKVQSLSYSFTNNDSLFITQKDSLIEKYLKAEIESSWDIHKNLDGYKQNRR